MWDVSTTVNQWGLKKEIVVTPSHGAITVTWKVPSSSGRVVCGRPPWCTCMLWGLEATGIALQFWI